MKKFLTVVFTFVLALLTVFSTACKQPDDNSLKFYAPDGAPALAIAKFINDNENFGIEREVSYIVVSANDIGDTMSQGKGDFIVMPVNAASKLYKANPNSPYVMTAVITHGNLYLMSSNGVNTLEDLKGKVVGVIGQGLVPDLTLRAILSDNGLLDGVVQVGDTATDGKITLSYFADAQAMIPMLKQGVLSVGLLPEPAATKLTSVAPDKTWSRLDVQELYDGETKSYPQAVLMVKKSVYDQYKDNVDGIKDMFADNVSWVTQNTEAAVNAVNGKLPEGVTPSLVAANITSTVVANCKIYYESAAQAKQSVLNYINKIKAVADKSANAVTDDFFA